MVDYGTDVGGPALAAGAQGGRFIRCGRPALLACTSPRLGCAVVADAGSVPPPRHGRGSRSLGAPPPLAGEAAAATAAAARRPHPAAGTCAPPPPALPSAREPSGQTPPPHLTRGGSAGGFAFAWWDERWAVGDAAVPGPAASRRVAPARGARLVADGGLPARGRGGQGAVGGRSVAGGRRRHRRRAHAVVVWPDAADSSVAAVVLGAAAPGRALVHYDN